MSTLRVGTTEKYAQNFDKIFGKKRTKASSASKKSSKSAAKKTTSRKPKK